MSNLDIERFRKVHALMLNGATEGERAAARSRATAMARKAGMTLLDAVSKMDTQPKAKPASFFDGFDDWMEECEPGYKAKRAAEKAEKEYRDAIRRKEVLAKYGSENALFQRTERERLLADAVADMAKWQNHIADDGIVYTYADEIDGKRDFWHRSDLTDRVHDAVSAAYAVPMDLEGVLAEYLDWEELQDERELFCGGEWNHHLEVMARIAVLKDVLDNRPVCSWDDMNGRIGWWEERLSWDFTPSLQEERTCKDRIAADLQILRRLHVNFGQPAASTVPQPERRTNAAKRDAVMSILDGSPELSDREIARRAGVSPQTVCNWRKRLASQPIRKAA